MDLATVWLFFHPPVGFIYWDSLGWALATSTMSSSESLSSRTPIASSGAGAAEGGGDPTCHTLLILRDLYPSPSVVLAFLESRLKAISREDAYVAAVSSNNVVDPKPAPFADEDRNVLDSASIPRDANDGRDMLVECRLPPQEGVSVRFEILYRPLTGPAKRAPTRDEWRRCVAAFGASMPDALGEGGGGGGGDPTQSAQAQAQRQSEGASSASAAAGSTSGRRGQEEEEEPRRQTTTAHEAVKGQEDAEAGEEEEEDLVAATPHLRLFQVYSAGVGHLEGSRYWRQLDRERSKHVRETKREKGVAAGERNGDAANKQEEQVWASAAGIHVVPIAEHGEFSPRRAGFWAEGGASWLLKQGETKKSMRGSLRRRSWMIWVHGPAVVHPPDKRGEIGRRRKEARDSRGGCRRTRASGGGGGGYSPRSSFSSPRRGSLRLKHGVVIVDGQGRLRSPRMPQQQANGKEWRRTREGTWLSWRQGGPCRNGEGGPAERGGGPSTGLRGRKRRTCLGGRGVASNPPPPRCEVESM